MHYYYYYYKHSFTILHQQDDDADNRTHPVDRRNGYRCRGRPYNNNDSVV